MSGDAVKLSSGWDDGLGAAVAANMQKAFDAAYRTHVGRPIEEIRPAVQRSAKRFGYTIGATQLEVWSAAISDGTRIDLTLE